MRRAIVGFSRRLFGLQDVDGPDLIGRFSTTAKLNLLEHLEEEKKYPFKWYEFKIGEKTAGELLAAFELIEIDEVHSIDAFSSLIAGSFS